MKKGLIVFGLLMVAGLVLAQTVDIASPQYYGKTKIAKAYAVIDANFAKVGGAYTETSVTNGQPLTLTSGTYVLTGVGSAANATNTVTIGNVAVDTKIRLVGSSAMTNHVAVAEGVNLYLRSTTVAIGPNDVLCLYAPSATNMVGESYEDN